MKTLVVVNPTSGGGRTAALWRTLAPTADLLLSRPEVRQTRRSGEATEITRAALAQGFERIVALGGDGTCHEVVNGFFDPDSRAAIAPQAIFAFVRSGTGGDLARTFEQLDAPASQLKRIAASDATPIDVIGCSWREGGGGWEISVNIASVGQGGDVCKRVDSRRKFLGGALPFAVATLESLAVTRPWRVELRFDDGPVEAHTVRNVVAANGRYHGGGMHIAPMAVPDDGEMDVVLLGALSRLQSLLSGPAIYRGQAHLRSGNSHRRCRKLTVATEAGQAPMLLEMDGEVRGTVPLTFELLPSALRLAR